MRRQPILPAKRSKLGGIFSSLGSVTKRGLAGWISIIGAVIVVGLVSMTLLAPFVRPYNPLALNVGPPLSPPSSQYLLGTNELGQDMFSRVISGGIVMLQVPFLAVAICASIGVPLGLFSSYIGGKLDKVLSLVMDSIYAFPGLVLAIAIAAVLGRGVINMAISIAVVYVPSYFRVIRSQVLTIKELSYTEAARSIGAPSRTILRRYVLPNVLSSIVVIVTVNFADAVLTAAGLTFVGLGIERTSLPDWGVDLTEGRNLMLVGAWWVMMFPGLMIVLLAMGFTLLGEGLNEILNPKLEERGEK